MNMPDYTLEEKAQAFDILWKNCGHDRGQLWDYVNREVSRAANEITYQRVPRYKYEICAEGDFDCFADVLHLIATKGKQ